jgi:choline dehydrogenase
VQFSPANNQYRIKNASVPTSASGFSATGGPLKVSYSNWGNAFSSWLIKSLSALGLKEVPDFVSGKLEGYQYVAATLDRDSQSRSSSETSFLRQALATTNIVLYTNTLAEKVLFDANKKAVGVSVSRQGIHWTLKANKEVIVSAGTVRYFLLLVPQSRY